MLQKLQESLPAFSVRKESKNIVMVPLMEKMDKTCSRNIQNEYTDQLRRTRRDCLQSLKGVKDEDLKESMKKHIDEHYETTIKRLTHIINEK